MKKEAIWDRFKTAAVVITMTVLIWVVADQYVREEQPSTRIPIRVTSSDPKRYAAIAGPPYQVTLRVTLVGRRKHLKEFNALLDAKPYLEAVVDETRMSDADPQAISAMDLLKSIKAVRESSLHIKRKSVSPEVVLVRIDDYEDVPNVVVEPDCGDLQVLNPSCQPSRVSVRLPGFARQTLLSEPVIRPQAEGAIREATRTHPEFQVSLVLSLDADPEMGIEISPDKVLVSGFVEALNATKDKGPVQITFSIPDEVQERFVVVASPDTIFRRTIEVTGRKDLLEKLEPRDILALVDVLAADMDEPGKEISRPVRYVLPCGFTLAPGFPIHTLTFRLVRRTASAPPGT